MMFHLNFSATSISDPVLKKRIWDPRSGKNISYHIFSESFVTNLWFKNT